MEAESTLSNSFFETSIIVIPNPEKGTIRNENYGPIYFMNLDIKILNDILAN